MIGKIPTCVVPHSINYSMLVKMNKYNHNNSQRACSLPTVELLTILGVENVTVCEQIDSMLVSHQQDKLNRDL